MKRFGVLFVLAIFILSMVPAALAEEVDASVENAEITVSASDDSTSDTLTQETAQNLLKMRAKGEIGEAKSAFVEAKDHFQELKSAYNEERGKFVEARKAFKECKEKNETDCNSEDGGVNTATRHYLLNAADLILGELESVKEKVSASEQLSEDEKAEIIADIEDRISEVTAAKAEVEAMDTDTPREDLNAAAKTIRDAWKDVKVALKKHLGRLVNARLGNIIERSEQLSEKLAGISEKLAEKGKDVSALNTQIDSFNAKIAEAKTAYEDAKAIYDEAKGGEDFDAAVKEAHARIIDAQKSLKAARDILREAVKEIKDLNKGSLKADTASEEPAPEADATA